jgi:hypothetical protein
MNRMATLRKVLPSHVACGMFCLALSLSQGCARPEPLHPTNAESPSGEQKLPFRTDADPTAPSDEMQTAVSSDPKLAAGLPFRAGHLRILPAGTLLTVQLEDSLSSDRVHAGDPFTASVAAPLTLDGDTLIERGTAVTGRVESAQSQPRRPGLVPGSGYFRLTLSAMTVEGRQLALQTSSLFARGADSSNVPSRSNLYLRSDGIQVQKGRRLTFRLTAPVTLSDPNSMADRQSLGPIPE